MLSYEGVKSFSLVDSRYHLNRAVEVQSIGTSLSKPADDKSHNCGANISIKGLLNEAGKINTFIFTTYGVSKMD